MGSNYTYEVIGKRKAAEPLVQALAKRLASHSRAKLLDALAGGVEQTMDEFERETKSEQRLFDMGAKDMCLSFSFERDDVLAEYAARADLAVDFEAQVAVGCVWTSVELGDEFTLIRASAATSWMSYLFGQSPSVRLAFSEISREGGGLVALLDDEADDDIACVWPYGGRFEPYHRREYGPWEIDYHTLDADYHSRKVVEDVRAAFGPVPPGA